MADIFVWPDTLESEQQTPESPAAPATAPNADTMSYRRWESEIKAPRWQRNPAYEQWNRASGDVKDTQVERAIEAVLARYFIHAPKDGLQLLGAERKLPRNATAADAEYAARLKNAWELHRLRGTCEGVLRALEWLGYEAVIYSSQLKYTLVNGVYTETEYHWPFTKWTEFLIAILGPIPTANDRSNILTTIRQWKSSVSIGVCVFIGDVLTWGHPTGTWGEEKTMTWGEVGSDTAIWENI